MDITKKEKWQRWGGNRGILARAFLLFLVSPTLLRSTSLVFTSTSNDFRLMIAWVQITVLLQITSYKFVTFTTFHTDGFPHSYFLLDRNR